MQTVAFDVYRPEINVYPDTAGLYPYTFNANPKNSGERLQTLANLACVTIYATDLTGQETGEIFGEPARKALKPGRAFYETSNRQAEVLAESDFFKHDTRIGLGDSLGVTSVLSLFGCEEVPNLFSALQLRDGFNLRNFQSVSAVAYADYFRYQLQDAMKKPISKPPYPSPPLTPISHISELAPRNRRRQNIISKILSLGPLMRDRLTICAALEVAGDTDMPLHLVGFKHGLSGSVEAVTNFFDDMVEERARMATYWQHFNKDWKPAQLHQQIIPGWHSDLLNPQLAAHHLGTTLSLIEEV